MPAEEVVVRPGEIGDMAGVRDLIVELAVYEKAPDEVEMTVEGLQRDGFGKEKLFDTFVAVAGERIVGFALYYKRYSTWKGMCMYLEDLMVTEDYRRSGIGLRLFNAVARRARDVNAARLEWQVLEWNQHAIDFYNSKISATLDPEWINCKLVRDQLQSRNLS